MSVRFDHKPRAMVLPTLMLLATVLMVLTSALLMTSTSSMRVTTFDQQSDVALYAAETGLSRATEEYVRTGSVKDSAKGTLQSSGATYVVQVILNDTDEPMPVAGGPHIPPSTLYLLAEGSSPNKTTRRVGALFRVGLGAFQVGVISDTLTASSSRFNAYDSSKNPEPSLSAQPGHGIMASNRVDPTVVDKQFELRDTVVEGGVFTAPATAPADQIRKVGATMVARESSLAEPISLHEIEVPRMQRGEASGGETTTTASGAGEADLSTYNPPPWQLTKGAPTELQVTYDAANERFVFEDLGQPGPRGTLSVTNFRAKTEAGTPFSFSVGPSTVYLNFQQDPPTIGYHDQNTASGFQATADVPFPSILTDVAATGTPSVRNPDDLGRGEYGSIVIDDASATELEDGTYVVKRLEITGSGQLALPAGKKATIYVTEHLSATGPDALVNASKLPPNLKIFYTGDEPVMLAGGSRSYLTLVAPKAAVQLTGASPSSPTTFYGALVGRTVEVRNALFHYDVATAGVGTGTDGSTLSLLSRQRL